MCLVLILRKERNYGKQWIYLKTDGMVKGSEMGSVYQTFSLDFRCCNEIEMESSFNLDDFMWR